MAYGPLCESTSFFFMYPDAQVRIISPRMIKGNPAITDVREGKAKYKKKAAPVKLSVILFLEIDCLRNSEKVCCN